MRRVIEPADIFVSDRGRAKVLCKVACMCSDMHRKAEAIEALTKAWEAGFRNGDSARRDPDRALLKGDPRLGRLYPEGAAGEWRPRRRLSPAARSAA